MKIIKRLLAVFAVLFILLIGAAIAIPYFFKDDILAALKETINNNVNAEVDFADIDISLLRSFPDFSLGINNYSAIGKDDFAGITLAEGESMDLTLDIWSVIDSNTPIQLKSINFDSPKIHVIVTRDGQANYDIFGATSDTTTTASTEFVIQLDEYSIENANLVYDDRTMPVYVELKELNHEGSGNFTQDIYDLVTTTNIKSFTTKYDGITYLTKAETDLEATININNSTARYTLKENQLRVNDLTVNADGWLEMAGDDINMDLKFGTPENDFRSLFSLIPSAYIADYEDVDVKGQFELDGMAQGTFNSVKEAYPAFALNMKVQDGDVKYPDLPLGISDIYTDLAIKHGGGNLNKMVVDIDNFRLKIGNNPINGRFKLRTPLTDPDIDTRIKGILNLSELAQAFPMEGVNELSGIINADVTADARMSAIDSGNYQDVEMEGTASVKNVNYNADGLPPVKVNSLQMDFSPTKIVVDNFNTNLGKSDLRGSGQVDNILAFFAKDKTMVGKFNLVSNYFNADEWMTTEESAAPVSNSATAPPVEATEPFENFAFDFDAVMDKIDYDIYEITDLAGEGKIASNTLTINDFYTVINGSDIRARGTINNILNFVNYNEGIQGNINFTSNNLDLDALAGTETTPTTTTSTEPVTSEIPDIKYDLDLNGTAKKVKYDIYTLTDMKLDGNLTEKQVKIDAFKSNLGNSDLAGSGVINDYMEYVFKNETVSGTLDFRSNYFDANEFLAEDPNAVATATPTETEPVPVPPNMAFDINADIDEVVYTNMKLRNMKGKIVVAEEAVVMEDVTMETLGGRVGLAGSYDTKDIANPAFSFKYDLQDLQFKESFNTVNTFAAAAPIAKFLNGAFNSTLVMDGTLGKDMMPNLSSLSADGFLQTLQATLEGFIPFQQIGDKLGVDAFDNMKIKGTKNWFTIKEGRVDVQPFEVTLQDIPMNVSGSHGLDQTLAYDIVAKIPRSLLGKGAVGSAANKGLDFLSGQASRLGLNIANSEFVNVKIGLGGSVTNPKIDIKLLGGEGEGGATVADAAKAEVKEQVDQIKKEAEAEIRAKVDEQKDMAEAKAKAVRDSIQRAAEQKAEEARKKAEAEIAKKAEEAKAKIGEEAAKKAEEAIGDVIDEETKNEIKDKLKDFNPFKKKKKKKDNEEGGGN